MLQMNAEQLERLIDLPSLIIALEQGFRDEIFTPQRHHHDIDENSTLLLMPAWYAEKYVGIKLITMNANNKSLGLPSIQGIYLLIDKDTGKPLAQIDAPSLTNLRTAAVSALAAKFLAPRPAGNLLVVGSGSLSPYLLRAHAVVRNYDKIQIWGRNPEKASSVVTSLKDTLEVEVVTDLASAVSKADVVSVATLSSDPVIFGKWLNPGTHVDLVGSYKPNMREADDLVIKRARIFIDTEHAISETGDLAIPLKNGTLTIDAIVGNLFQLCRGQIKGRLAETEITLFKSVGHASEDLIGAVLAYEKSKAN
jgi:ornithine cyclodeaminase